MLKKKRTEKLFWILALSALIISLLWPGDAYWGDIDQEHSIRKALQSNINHEWAPLSSGRLTSVGVRTSPLAIWIYQFFLFVTGNNLLLVIFLRQLIMLVVCLAGLYYLGKVLKYPLPFIFVFLFSFQCYLFSRTLNVFSFFIPLTLFLFVLYARFYRKKSFFSLALIGFCAIIIIYIRPAGLIPIVPFILMLFGFDYRWFRKHRRGVSVMIIGFLIICLPFLGQVVEQLQNSYATLISVNWSQIYNLPSREGFLDRAFYLVTGGVLFSYDFLQLAPESMLDKIWIPPFFSKSLILITMMGYFFLVFGMIITLYKASVLVKQKRSLELEDRIGLISLISILFHIFVIVALGRWNHFYYHVGIWFCNFFLIWRTIKEIQQKKPFTFILPVYLIAMMVLWGNVKIFCHVYNGFNVSNAIRIADRIAEYSPESDVVFLTDLADMRVALADVIISNSENAVLKFYYQKLGLIFKSAFESSFFRQENNFYESFKPLVYISRQEKGGRNLPTRTLVVKIKSGAGSEAFEGYPLLFKELDLIDDPQQVYRLLKRQRRL